MLRARFHKEYLGRLEAKTNLGSEVIKVKFGRRNLMIMMLTLIEFGWIGRLAHGHEGFRTNQSVAYLEYLKSQL